jgi:hypothetical protein
MSTLSEFNVGDKVYFGRTHGEQTLGTVMKLGRSKLKVRQDESRGAMKSHPVGTIWTVPPSLCRKADGSATTTPAPKVPSTLPTAMTSFKVGDRVSFDARARIITGTVKRINGKTIAVLPDGETDPRRYWRVSPGFCRPASTNANANTAAPASTNASPALTLRVGTTVEYTDFVWPKGNATVTGIITKVGDDKYEVCSHGRFTTKTPEAVKAVAKRSDADIVAECLSVYCGLSPENLTCDGEASQSEVSRRAAQYNRALHALWKEAGRSITETECWKAAEQRKAGGC